MFGRQIKTDQSFRFGRAFGQCLDQKLGLFAKVQRIGSRHECEVLIGVSKICIQSIHVAGNLRRLKKGCLEGIAGQQRQVLPR